MDSANKERLLQLTRANPGLSTREYQEICRTEGFWDDEFYEKAVDKAEMYDLRSGFCTLKDETGHRIVHSVMIPDPDTGRVHRYYIHEAAMDRDEYQRVIEGYLARIYKACVEVVALAQRCQERYGVKVPIPREIRSLADEYEAQVALANVAEGPWEGTGS